MSIYSKTIQLTEDNFSNNNTTKFEYKYSQIDNNKLSSTSYTNSIDSSGSIESFNKLYKENNIIHEKIGNSTNKKSWNIKEFINTNLEKEYNDSYDSIIFKFNDVDCIQEIFSSVDNNNKNNMIKL